MPRRNRVDPFGELQAVAARQGFTGNRGCLVDDDGHLVRHHNGSLWILCRLRYRGWRKPLDAPRTWTPLFFLDDAVGLAAGHRPCGLCRRDDYRSYQAAVGRGLAAERPVLATELNRRLAAERLRPRRRRSGRSSGSGAVPGRRLERRDDRLLTTRPLDRLPDGVVVVHRDSPHLVLGPELQPFSFEGWAEPIERPVGTSIEVLTPPTSLLALANGFVPTLHPSAGRPR